VSLIALIVVLAPPFLMFVLGLGVVVAAVTDHGLGRALAPLMPAGTSAPGLPALLATAALAAALANVCNNLPAAPAGVRFTLLHVTADEVPEAARGAYAGLLGRAGPDPGARLAEMAAAAARDLLDAAADRLGRPGERLEIQGRPERAVVAASASADLLILARDGDRTRLGPKSLGKATRFVVDHAACPVLLVWPGFPPGVGTMPAPPRHPST
jgi:nucleotide-binding universal stress UspA family protein